MRKLFHGWNPDRKEFVHRDKLYRDSFKLATAFPASLSLRPWMPLPVYDQANLGSCVGHGTATVIRYLSLKLGKPDVPPSRLFIYLMARELEGGDWTQDTGCEIRDAMTAVNAFGVPPEPVWDYTDGTIEWPQGSGVQVPKFSIEPPAEVFVAATHDFVVNRYLVDQTEQGIKSCLLEGYPVVFGFQCFQQFESDQIEADGILQMPPAGVTSIGGHCTVVDGWDSNGMWDVRNSYGPDWGQSGYFKMPFDYLLSPDLANDLWTVRGVYTGV